MLDLELLKNIIDEREKRLGGADPSDMRQAGRVVWRNYLKHFVSKSDGRSLRERVYESLTKDLGIPIRSRAQYKTWRDEYVDNTLVCELTMVLPTA